MARPVSVSHISQCRADALFWLGMSHDCTHPSLHDHLVSLPAQSHAVCCLVWVPGPGLRVTEHIRVDGRLQRRIFTHRVFLTGIHADTPAMRKLSLWVGHNARLGCGWCWLRGQWLDGSMKFLGYSHRAAAGVMGVDAFCDLMFEVVALFKSVWSIEATVIRTEQAAQAVPLHHPLAPGFGSKP